jgi:diguanylate cyclase (GGDEF)-like protein
MSALNAIRRFLAVPDDRDLVQAQARVLSRQVPLMYVILLTNTLVLSATHAGAPDLLRLYVPAALTVICAIRVAQWWRRRQLPLTDAQARRLVSSTVRVSWILGIGFVAWALSLYPYGGAFEQAHVAFYIAITSICCIFCLMYLRSAATLVAITVAVPFTAFFASTGHGVFVALAFNFMIVLAGLTFVLFGNYRNFAALVASRSEMARRQDETQRLSDENVRLANMDSLTGLPNRRSFDRQLRETLEAAERTGAQIAVARLDLDSFKTINETFGQNTGDRVLAEVAKRLLVLRAPDTFIARLDADNFALILQGKLNEADLRTRGEVLCNALRISFDMPDANIHLSASVGFATSRPGDTGDTLFDRADYVTSIAKREARGHAVIFSERHAREISKVRTLEHALRTADLDEEIYILFQPQFDVALNRTTGYEVLARWRSPTLGEVSPSEFIPMAERTGMVSKITHTVLRKALAASARLPKSMRLSVNLSAHDLSSTTTIGTIVGLVTRAGTPCRIDFEITETAVMRDMNQANQALLVLLALGSRIALDDFGTGHSSLTHVQKLPLDRIKVDRSFVAEVTTDPTSRAIIKTTVDLCRNLGISCVFEGIETEQQLDALLGLGGTVMQGYLFGRPMSEEMVLEHLSGERMGWQPHRSKLFGTAS